MIFLKLSDSFIPSTQIEVIGQTFGSNRPSRRKRLAKETLARWELQKGLELRAVCLPSQFGFKPGAPRVEGRSVASEEQGCKLPLCENKLGCVVAGNVVQVS